MAFIHNETGFSARVDRAIECLRLGAHSTTRYGACFADGDGAAVAAAVLHHAAGDPDLAEAIDSASRRTLEEWAAGVAPAAPDALAPLAAQQRAMARQRQADWLDGVPASEWDGVRV